MTATTDHVNEGLHEARKAIAKLVDLYFDNVPVDELEREQIVETIHEGLSDEFDRLYRIEATVDRVRALHDQLAAETALTSPGDPITRGAAAKRIATALDAST